MGNDNTAQFTGPWRSKSGKVVIGRAYTNADELYTTMEIDELTLWNNW